MEPIINQTEQIDAYAYYKSVKGIILCTGSSTAK